MDRPLAELVSRTNTSITVNWTAPTLQPSCTNVFFPPLMYMVRVRLQMDVVDGFPQVSTMYMYIALSLYCQGKCLGLYCRSFVCLCNGDRGKMDVMGLITCHKVTCGFYDVGEF